MGELHDSGAYSNGVGKTSQNNSAGYSINDAQDFNNKLREKINTSKGDIDYSKLLGNYKGYLESKVKLEKVYSDKIQKIRDDENLNETQKKKEIAIINSKIERDAIRLTAIYEENRYKQAGTAKKAQMQRQRAEMLAEEKKRLEEQYAFEVAMAEAAGQDTTEIKEKYQEDVSRVLKQKREAENAAAKLESSTNNTALGKAKQGINSVKSAEGAKDKSVALLTTIASFAKLDSKNIKDMAKSSKDNYKAIKEQTQQKKNELKEVAELYGEDSQEFKDAQANLEESYRQQNEAAADAILTDTLSKISDTLMSSFSTVENLLTEYKGHIDARLQGSEKTYDDVMNKISTNLAISPYVKSEKVIEKMRELVDLGVAYNLEQRAFLSTVSDKIASTFDAFDSTLLRLIKLQQADTTAARLGMEASLTKFFNGMFNDSSYLSTVADSISSAIIDANASMEKNASTEFEYIVQKWLGSLSSLGMSQDTLTQIATGINYLATGDVTSLASNTQLQTLMAMSAANAGLSYSDMLLEGLDASDTNKLLASMVTYLKTIAENSDNQVVRAAYGDIFNLSMSDLKAISNLTTSDIQTISNQTLAYSDMARELYSQMNQLSVRTSLSEMMENVFDNALFAAAEDVISNPAGYVLYKALNFMREQDVDFNIPSLSAAGFGLDLEASLTDLMNTVLQFGTGISLIGNVMSALGSGSNGGTNLTVWDATEYNTRGSSFSFLTSTQIGDTSGSTYVASGNKEDVTDSTLNSATDDAEDTTDITNKNQDTGFTVDDLYKSVIQGTDGDNFVRVQERILTDVYNSSSDYLGVRDSRLTFTSDKLLKVKEDTFSSVLEKKDSALRVKIVNDYLPVQINSIATSKNTEAIPVTIKNNSKDAVNVKIDSSAISTALNQWITASRTSNKISLEDILLSFASLIDDDYRALRIRAAKSDTVKLEGQDMRDLAQYISNALN